MAEPGPLDTNESCDNMGEPTEETAVPDENIIEEYDVSPEQCEHLTQSLIAASQMFTDGQGVWSDRVEIMNRKIDLAAIGMVLDFIKMTNEVDTTINDDPDDALKSCYLAVERFANGICT